LIEAALTSSNKGFSFLLQAKQSKPTYDKASINTLNGLINLKYIFINKQYHLMMNIIIKQRR